jgi:hypothetical protein
MKIDMISGTSTIADAQPSVEPDVTAKMNKIKATIRARKRCEVECAEHSYQLVCLRRVSQDFSISLLQAQDCLWSLKFLMVSQRHTPEPLA